MKLFNNIWKKEKIADKSIQNEKPFSTPNNTNHIALRVDETLNVCKEIKKKKKPR